MCIEEVRTVSQISKQWTQVVSGKFTREEEKIIRKEAEKQKVTVSEYVRGAVYMSLIMDGNVEAMKLAGGLVAAKVAEKFRGLAAGRELD